MPPKRKWGCLLAALLVVVLLLVSGGVAAYLGLYRPHRMQEQRNSALWYVDTPGQFERLNRSTSGMTSSVEFRKVCGNDERVCVPVAAEEIQKSLNNAGLGIHLDEVETCLAAPDTGNCDDQLWYRDGFEFRAKIGSRPGATFVTVFLEVYVRNS